MKNLKIIFIIVTVLGFVSCSDELSKMNIDPDIATEPNLDFLLTNNELQLLEQRYFSNFGFADFVDIFSEFGSNFETGVLASSNVTEYFFEQHYERSLKNLTAQILNSEDPEMVNYHSMARIMRAYIFQRLTDTYGNIPYFDAELGYEKQILEPAYDSQDSIYMDLLKELEESTAAFDNSAKTPGASDIVYGGDLGKWKRFGYSLMMRVALRMSNVRPDIAEEYVKKAYEGGAMEKTDDSFVVQYLENSDYATTANGNAKGILGYSNRKLSEYFINTLKNTTDPRLPFYAALPNGDNSFASQRGLPYFASEADFPLDSFSMANPNTFASFSAAFVHMSHAQVEFMVAEAIERGWLSGNTKDHYEEGVRSSMRLLNMYFSGGGEITDQMMDDYLQANPYNPQNFNEALEIISTQYWIDTYFNFCETYANWRRTDYPKLDNEDYPIPYRFKYPAVEYSANSKNVKEAAESMGEDSFTQRVWWDVDK